MGRAGGDCGYGRSYIKTSPKRGPKGLRGGRLRHCGLDLHRHLVAPDLQADRTNGGMVSRTRSVLQILHTPPSLPYVVLVGNKLRPHLHDVKQRPLYLVVVLHKQHYIWRKYSRLQLLNQTYPAGSGTLFSARVPPVIRQFSTGFPQSFAQDFARGVLRKSSAFPQVLRVFFVREIRSHCARIFISFFMSFPERRGRLSRRKNGRKQGGIRNLRKSRRAVSATTRCRGAAGGCTQNVARGTFCRLPGRSAAAQ